jgi:hypothetical protein
MSESRWPRRTAAAAGALLILLIAATRILARQKTLWEWDDFLFDLALRHFAPQLQIPQAPFYPGYVYLARLARIFLGSDVLALTWVSVAASAASPLLVFGIGRELGLERRIAGEAAVVFAFFPAVWLHAGVPLSDPAGLTAALLAVWLALRARGRPARLAAAGAALGIAFAIRPQAAVVAAVPLAASLAPASGRARAAGVFAAGAAAAVFYLAPIWAAAGSLRSAWNAFRWQGAYLVGTDSLWAPRRSLSESLHRYFVDAWGSPVLAAAVAVLVLLGAMAIARRLGPGSAALPLVCAGVCILPSVLFLDPSVAGRYLLPALPFVAILAAAGCGEIERRLPGPDLPLVSAALAGFGAALVLPAIFILHGRASAPVEAARAIRTSASPGSSIVYAPGLRMQASILFPGWNLLQEGREPAGPAWRFGVYPDSGPTSVAWWPPLAAFTRVGRGRYLEVPYGRLEPSRIRFGRGWYAREVERRRDAPPATFRWMGRTGEIWIEPGAAPARLSISLQIPLFALARPPRITLTLDGRVLDERTASANRLVGSYELGHGSLRSDGESRLVLRTDETFVPARRGFGGDARELGLQLRSVRLSPGGEKVPELP